MTNRMKDWAALIATSQARELLNIEMMERMREPIYLRSPRMGKSWMAQELIRELQVRASPVTQIMRYHREYMQEVLAYGIWPDVQSFISRKRAETVHRVEQDRRKPWADVEYPRDMLRLRVDTWTEPKPNVITHDSKGGTRVNEKRVDGHKWLGHELDCFRLYPTAPAVAKRTGRPKR